MKALNFFKPVLTALNDGKVIRSSVALVLKILGVLSLLGGVYLVVEILKASFRLPAEGTVGGLLLSIIFVAALLAVVQIFFYRAASIRDHGDSQFTIIPIFSILFKCIGEIYATFGAAIAVGGCMFIWLSKRNPLRLLKDIAGFFPSLTPEGTFVGGLLFLMFVALFSFAAITVFYLLAEVMVALTEIARRSSRKD